MAESRERIIVGYVADARGCDVLEFASMLAADTGAELIITLVLPEPNAYATASVGTPVPADHYYASQLREWAEQALAQIPEGIDAWVDRRTDDSAAAGLLLAAEEHDASLIVIGTESSPVLSHFTLGSVANAVLHSSPFPVALAPRGFKNPGTVTRVNAVYGTRPGAKTVIGSAVQRAEQRKVPLRLVSLVQLDQVGACDAHEVSEKVRAYGGEQLEEIAVGMLESGLATIEIVEGDNFAEAASKITWQDGDIAFVGSSRLGRGRGVFLGSKARALLSALDVPVVVLPRDYAGPESRVAGPMTGAVESGESNTKE